MRKQFLESSISREEKRMELEKRRIKIEAESYKEDCELILRCTDHEKRRARNDDISQKVNSKERTLKPKFNRN